jgi:ribosomal subunit interface protein
MDIRISGHQMDIGAALSSHIKTRLEAIVEKYFSKSLSAHITLGKGPHDMGFVCDVVFHAMHGVILKGTGHASDAYLAFDESALRIEKQLRRYMRRLKDRHSPAAGAHKLHDADAAAYEHITDARYTVFQPVAEVEDAADAPAIVAETKVDVPTASVSDAVMMLDLRNTNALLFKHSATGAFNMVYRRNDGSIGWVEPATAL